MFTCVVLLIQFSLLGLGRVRAQQQTGLQYEGVSEVRGERSSSARVGREALEKGLTIDTLPDNMTHLVDSGRYYSWQSFGQGDSRTGELWVVMSDLQQGQVRMHGILSNTHRQAAKVALSFDFPFYGHYLRQVTIATGGFIFMGDVTHRMLTATQYIAPLMANFDPSYSKDSTVQYLDNGEVFVVQWERVRLQGRETEGAFTFQAALHRSGNITFSYQDIPMSVEVISSPEHPVKAGLSDAFMVLKPSPLSSDVQRRTVYEYHRVEVDTAKITNHSAFEFTPLPTCLSHNSCELCLSTNPSSGCTWCNVLQRCSDGMDRHRQEWLDYGCSEESTDVSCEDYSREGTDSSIDPPGSSIPETPTHFCPLPESSERVDDTKRIVKYNDKDLKTGHPRQHEGTGHTGLIAGVVAAVVLLLALVLLALYINSNALSPIYLIQRRSKYWPSMTFRRKVLQSSYTQVEFEGHC